MGIKNVSVDQDDGLPGGVDEPAARPTVVQKRDRAAGTRPSLAVSERRLMLILTDALLILGVAYLLSFFRGPGDIRIGIPYAILWLVIGLIAGLYELSTAARTRQCMVALAQTGLIFAGVPLVVFIVLLPGAPAKRPGHLSVLHLANHHLANAAAHPFLISRPKLFIMAILPLMVIAVWRLGYIRFFGAAHFQRRVLVVGAGTASTTLLRAVRSHPGHGVAVVGLLDDDRSKIGTMVEGVPVIGDSSTMWPVVSDLKIEEVVLAINQPTTESLLQGLGVCYEHSVAVSLMPHLYEEVTGQVPVEFMGPHWFGSIQVSRTGGGMSLAVKRIVDVILGILALIVFLPVIVVVAVLVKVSSRGAVLHKQERVGLHGGSFRIVKFRTMRIDAERPGEAMWAEPDDPRATSLGRWLRRTHLDELPQFFLVVKGDMSLVGPRPERPAFVTELEHTIPLYRARYSMRPGIAGWAQLHYPYGASVEDALAKLRYDLYYIKNWSPILDLVILIRTVARVLALRGR